MQNNSNDQPSECYELTLNEKKLCVREIILNNTKMKMQLDTGSQATLIPKNFWLKCGSPKLSPSFQKLRQFDGSVIKTIEKFEGTLEFDDEFKITTVIVTECEKTHGLIGTDIPKLDQRTISIQSSETENSKIGCLVGFSASLQTKYACRPSYF